ncbi:MAG: CBS and ACT domain-containing protein [Actinobacteria bacterium]|nr:CBS and ACT domain-containing protein [Actinomycetota bacterium]
MYVRDFMSTNVITISPDGSLADAFALMKENRIRRLPVIEGDRLVGIVAYSDLLKASPSEATSLSIWEINYVLSKLKISDIMKTNVITVETGDPIEKAAILMRNNDIGALPVMDSGRLVGIITESDIFDAFIDVMGVGVPGTRLTIEIEDRPGQILEVIRPISEEGINIRSIATFHAKDRQELVIRIETENPEGIIEKLKSSGLRVLHYEVF